MELRDGLVLEHIGRHCEDIEDALRRINNDYEAFRKDRVYYNAVSMALMQIGELTAKLSKEFRSETSGFVTWSLIKDMRNRFAHSYDDMSPEIIWETATGDIPSLKKHCREWLTEAGMAEAEPEGSVSAAHDDSAALEKSGVINAPIDRSR